MNKRMLSAFMASVMVMTMNAGTVMAAETVPVPAQTEDAAQEEVQVVDAQEEEAAEDVSEDELLVMNSAVEIEVSSDIETVVIGDKEIANGGTINITETGALIDVSDIYGTVTSVTGDTVYSHHKDGGETEVNKAGYDTANIHVNAYKVGENGVDEEPSAMIEAGTYQLRVAIDAKGGYTATVESDVVATVNVLKNYAPVLKEVTVDVDDASEKGVITYDGRSHAAELTNFTAIVKDAAGKDKVVSYDAETSVVFYAADKDGKVLSDEPLTEITEVGYYVEAVSVAAKEDINVGTLGQCSMQAIAEATGVKGTQLIQIVDNKKTVLNLDFEENAKNQSIAYGTTISSKDTTLKTLGTLINDDSMKLEDHKGNGEFVYNYESTNGACDYLLGEDELKNVVLEPGVYTVTAYWVPEDGNKYANSKPASTTVTVTAGTYAVDKLANTVALQNPTTEYNGYNQEAILSAADTNLRLNGVKESLEVAGLEAGKDYTLQYYTKVQDNKKDVYVLYGDEIKDTGVYYVGITVNPQVKEIGENKITTYNAITLKPDQIGAPAISISEKDLTVDFKNAEDGVIDILKGTKITTADLEVHTGIMIGEKKDQEEKTNGQLSIKYRVPDAKNPGQYIETTTQPTATRFEVIGNVSASGNYQAGTTGWISVNVHEAEAEKKAVAVLSIVGSDTVSKTYGKDSTALSDFTEYIKTEKISAQTKGDYTVEVQYFDKDGKSIDESTKLAAGDYTATVTYKSNDTSKFADSKPVTIKLHVEKGTPVITPGVKVELSSIMYTGNEIKAVAIKDYEDKIIVSGTKDTLVDAKYNTTPANAMQVKFYKVGDLTHAYDYPVDAGQYTVNVILPETENYKGAETASLSRSTVTIGKRTIGAELKANLVKAYTGKAAEITVEDINVQGLVGKDTVEDKDLSIEYYAVDKDGKETKLDVAPTEPGKYKAVVNVKELANYKATKKIAKEAFTIAASDTKIVISEDAKAYTGKAVAADVTVKDSQKADITDAKATITYYADEAMKEEVKAEDVVNAGTYYVKAAYAGVEGKYNASEATGKLVVEPAVYPAEKVNLPKDLNEVFGQKIGAITFPADEAGTWAWVDGEEVKDAAGDYKVKAVFTPNDKNYKATEFEVSVTITKAHNAKINITKEADKSYDGKAAAAPTFEVVDAEGKVMDVKATLVWNTENGKAPVNPGQYSYTITVPETDNTAEVKLTKTMSITINDIGQFVYRMYTTLLNRTPDAGGFASWKEGLTNKSKLGADIGWGFAESAEFIDRNLSDNEFVDAMYTAFFARHADEEGKTIWMNLLANGCSREYVYAGFANSVEFANLCGRYNIDQGSIKLTAPRDQNANVTQFVNRLYTEALQRNADIDGLNNWCDSILKKQNNVKEVARGFILSTEVTNQKLSDKDYVSMLYRTYLGRTPKNGEEKDWVNELKAGKSRTEIIKGFEDSKEFAEIVANFGL